MWLKNFGFRAEVVQTSGSRRPSLVLRIRPPQVGVDDAQGQGLGVSRLAHDKDRDAVEDADHHDLSSNLERLMGTSNWGLRVIKKEFISDENRGCVFKILEKVLPKQGHENYGYSTVLGHHEHWTALARANLVEAGLAVSLVTVGQWGQWAQWVPWVHWVQWVPWVQWDHELRVRARCGTIKGL